jgi:hypothetical protein
MKISTKYYICFFVFYIIIIFSLCFIFDNKEKLKNIWRRHIAMAFQRASVTGFAWSENIGWVSHNHNDVGNLFFYGVDLNDEGNLIGWGWAKHFGWINYDPNGHYPAGNGLPDYSAKWDACTGKVKGWAQIEQLKEYGYNTQSWVLLGSDQSDFGVRIDPLTGKFSGWAWNPFYGWFNYRTVSDKLNFGVKTSLESLRQRPYIPYLIDPLDDKLVKSFTPKFVWSKFDDPNCKTDYQTQFQLQIYRNKSLTDLHFDTGKVFSDNNYYNILKGVLVDGRYWWRVRVSDQTNKWSHWAKKGKNMEENSFIVIGHRPPLADFTWQPRRIEVDLDIQFIDKSVSYDDDGNIDYWLWEFYVKKNINQWKFIDKIAGSTKDKQNPV